MRTFTIVLLTLTLGGTAACTDGATQIGNPLMLPIRAVQSGTTNASYNATRGQVEIFVKTNHPALIADIQRGGGPTLTEAFDIANAPGGIRAEHTLQLQSNLALYNTNLDALVVAIMVVSS